MNPRQLLDTFLGAITGFLVVVLLVDLVSSQAETLSVQFVGPWHQCVKNVWSGTCFTCIIIYI